MSLNNATCHLKPGHTQRRITRVGVMPGFPDSFHTASSIDIQGPQPCSPDHFSRIIPSTGPFPVPLRGISKLLSYCTLPVSSPRPRQPDRSGVLGRVGARRDNVRGCSTSVLSVSLSDVLQVSHPILAWCWAGVLRKGWEEKKRLKGG